MRLLVLISLISCILFSCDEVLAGDSGRAACHLWESHALDKPPDWYAKMMSDSLFASKESLGDTIWRYTYLISDTVSVIRQEVADSREDTTSGYWLEPGVLFVEVGGTSYYLDSSRVGFSHVTCNSSGSLCAVLELRYISEDGGRGDIVLYDLNNEEKRVIHPNLSSIGPQFSPTADLLAYSDVADVFIYDVGSMSAEPVFNLGGSYARGLACCRWHVATDLRWSTDGSRLVFKYYPSVFKDEYQLYEVIMSDE